MVRNLESSFPNYTQVTKGSPHRVLSHKESHPTFVLAGIKRPTRSAKGLLQAVGGSQLHLGHAARPLSHERNAIGLEPRLITNECKPVSVIVEEENRALGM